MNLTFETEQEADGRWQAEVPELLGVLASGATKQQAIIKAEALALRVLAEYLPNRSFRCATRAFGMTRLLKIIDR